MSVKEKYKLKKQCFVCGIGIGRSQYYNEYAGVWKTFIHTYQKTTRMNLKGKWRSVCPPCREYLDRLENPSEYVRDLYTYEYKKGPRKNIFARGKFKNE